MIDTQTESHIQFKHYTLKHQLSVMFNSSIACQSESLWGLLEMTPSVSILFFPIYNEIYTLVISHRIVTL